MPLSDDPVKRARQLANLRRGGRRGQRRRPLSPTSANRLPRQPFAAWLERVVWQAGGCADAAERLGIDERNVRVLRSHPGNVVNLATVDRLVTAAEEPHTLVLLYPWDGASHERFCSCCREQVTTSDDLLCPWCETETLSTRQSQRAAARSGRMVT